MITRTEQSLVLFSSPKLLTTALSHRTIQAHLKNSSPFSLVPLLSMRVSVPRPVSVVLL